jgi:hypothetical protein
VALSLALGLALPVLGARALSGACADALGDQIAARLVGALGPISSALAPPVAATDVLTETELASDARWANGAEPARAHATKHGKASAAHAVRISAAQVLSLAARRAMPEAVPVKANASHPSGLQLHGVSALGVGLQDGDVLTEAAGQRASSVAAVVGLVLAARARHSSEISGRFFRAGVPYALTVEQPYPPAT